jgi:hypothetical protein
MHCVLSPNVNHTEDWPSAHPEDAYLCPSCCAENVGRRQHYETHVFASCERCVWVWVWGCTWCEGFNADGDFEPIFALDENQEQGKVVFAKGRRYEFFKDTVRTMRSETEVDDFFSIASWDDYAPRFSCAPEIVREDLPEIEDDAFVWFFCKRCEFLSCRQKRPHDDDADHAK